MRPEPRIYFAYRLVSSTLATERIEGRLAAILAADVAGGSRLMGVGKKGTLAQLKAQRRELIDQTSAKHRGRIVKTMGGGSLFEFAIIVNSGLRGRKGRGGLIGST